MRGCFCEPRVYPALYRRPRAAAFRLAGDDRCRDVQVFGCSQGDGLDEIGQGKYLLSLNRNLILNSPLHYLEAVGHGAVAFWFPAFGMISNHNSKPVQLLWTLFHFVLIAAFFIQLIAIVGTALTNGLPDATRRLTYPYAVGLIVIFYTMTLSCLIDVGNPRFRVPTDGVIVLVTLIGIEMWKRIRSEQTIIRLRQRRERALGPPRGKPAPQFI